MAVRSLEETLASSLLASALCLNIHLQQMTARLFGGTLLDMRQLSGLDAAFLSLDTVNTTGHVGAVFVFDSPRGDGGLMTLDVLQDLFSSRLHRAPIMRKKLLHAPLGLDDPYWIDDATFDIQRHVFALDLPRPVAMSALAQRVSAIHAQPLHRDRPLWEVYLINGLEGDRIVLYCKLHHAMMDGVAAQDLFGKLLDLAPTQAEVTAGSTWRPQKPPGTRILIARTAVSLAKRPVRAVNVVTQIVTMRRDGERATSPTIRTHHRLLPPRAPSTPFNRIVTANRLVELRAVPLEAVSEVGRASNATVNDVVIAMCAGALRRWLSGQDAVPSRPLVAALPVAVPAHKAATGIGGNRFAVMLASVPTDVAEPLARLDAVCESTRRSKSRLGRHPKASFVDAVALAVPSLINPAVRLNTRLGISLHACPFNLPISNIAGPTSTLYLGQLPLREVFPISAILEGQGLNITVISYCGELGFGFVSDRDLVPDLGTLADFVVEELRALSGAVREVTS